MGAAYRFLLALFLPRTLRDAHCADMEALFSESVSEARAHGRVAAWRAAFQGMLDVAGRAPHEHWRRSGAIHTQNKEHPVQSALIDVRQAFRAFGRQRGATALVIGTLTLAVAANIAVFALLDGVFRRPFPFPQAERLVYLNERAPRWNLEYTNINYPDFVAWRERATVFESMALFGFSNVNVGDAQNAERVKGMRVTYEFARVLKVKPLLGRMFVAAEDVPDGAPVVVISESIWRSKFNTDSQVVGKILRVNSLPYTIVGVLPREAEFPDEVALWLPLGGNPNAQGSSYSYDGIGRLKPGVTIAMAERSLFAAHANIWSTRDTSKTVSPRVDVLRNRLVADFRTAGFALGTAAALVLCIACANVAGTMLARSIGRRNEIGIRVALGASSSRIMRLLLTESLLLSVIAGVLGSGLSYIALSLLLTNESVVIPLWAKPEVGVAAITFSVAVVTLSAFLFGLAPALQLRKYVASSGGAAGIRSAGSVPERKMLSALVVSEVAIAATLLVCGGLLFKSYNGMRQLDPGFRAEGVATFRMSLPDATYPNAPVQMAVYDRVIERLRALPGVDHAGAITCLPFACHNGNFFVAEGAGTPAADAVDPVTLVRTATPDYFKAMGIVVKQGRLFRAGEGGSGMNERVAVVNEQLARQLWPSLDAVGKRFRFRGSSSANWITVLGVVKDVRHYGLAKPMIPGLYLSTTALDSTDDVNSLGIAVHGSMSADELLPAMRNAVREVLPDVPLFEVQTLQNALDRSMAQQRLIALSLAVFAAVALALAMGGVYAVLSYVVGRRRREIAIRMTVGAQRRQVVRLVMRQGLRLTVIGLAIGVPLAAAGARGLSALLIGVSPADPVTYVAAAVTIVLVGLFAAAVPAIRASRVEPKAVLSESA